MGGTQDQKDPRNMPSMTPLPVELQGQLGKKLREAYSEIVAEPVPDSFLQLLQQLKSKETDSNGGGA
jgi:hypothetical protein